MPTFGWLPDSAAESYVAVTVNAVPDGSSPTSTDNPPEPL